MNSAKETLFPGTVSRSVAVAIVGTFGSGKTSLTEAILARCGAISRQGKVAEGNTLGDGSTEARRHAMSVEINVASCEYLGDSFHLIDCPGSIEFMHEADGPLGTVDLAIVVAEPEERKIPALQLVLKKLEMAGVPHMMFLNKIDKSEIGVRAALKMLAPASTIPLVLRQIPIREGGAISGFVDLALQRAHVYRPGAASEIVDIPEGDQAGQLEARYSMLETLSDHDDDLMEKLLSDIEPEKDDVLADLVQDARAGRIVPVFFGSAENGNGIGRLLKAVRHEVQPLGQTCARLGIGDIADAPSGKAGALLRAMKIIHGGHSGKLVVARLLSGSMSENTSLSVAGRSAQRPSGIFALMGQHTHKRREARAGDIIALGKLDEVAAGDFLTSAIALPDDVPCLAPPPEPVLARAIAPTERRDEVRLSAALARLVEEDRALAIIQVQDKAEIVLKGQGEMHLRVALERLESKYGLKVETHIPEIPYRETIAGGTTVRARHKKQSGGHGQFGDVVLDIKPLPRGRGFEFANTISGGVVPRQYIPSVENGAREALQRGSLGFPVVDLGVTLTDGSYHSVDSSDQAFKMAGILAIRKGLEQCRPVLLEPIYQVTIFYPADTTAKINAIVSARRGQLLGFEALPDHEGWDRLNALMPQSEIGDLIVELRSATAGVAYFSSRFDHMAELTGRAAEEAINRQAARLAG